VFECELFHDTFSLSEQLKNKFSQAYIRTFEKTLDYDTMMDKILKTKEIGGFITLEGGLDGVDTGCENDNVFGFCVTKRFPDSQEIGSYSRGQIKKYGCDVEAYCKKATLTVPRLNFPKDNHEVLSIQYFRWLVQARQLKDYKIHHVAAYTELPNLRGFLNDLLQKRWDLKKRGEGGELESLTCKLFVNSFYGYSSIFLPKYPKTRIRSESTILAQGLSKDVLNVTCMGYKQTGVRGGSSSSSSSKRSIRRNCYSREENDDYELMFSITEKNSKSKIENVAQVQKAF
jgi:hypothetical protein